MQKKNQNWSKKIYVMSGLIFVKFLSIMSKKSNISQKLKMGKLFFIGFIGSLLTKFANLRNKVEFEK